MNDEVKDGQGNAYDKIFRENMVKSLPGIIKKVLHLKVRSIRELPDDVQHTKERKADLITEVVDESGSRFILHIEYQRKNDRRNMVFRMAEYSIMFQRKYRLPVLQHVIYIGKGKATMTNTIDTKDLKYRFNLMALSEVDYKVFLESDTIEEKLSAILGDLGDHDPKEVLEQILLDIRLQNVSETEEGRYFKQLHILTKLRNFENDLEEVMETLRFNEKKDPFYIKGKNSGIEEGVEIGIETERIAIATNMKNQGLSVDLIATVTKLTLEQITKL